MINSAGIGMGTINSTRGLFDIEEDLPPEQEMLE